MKPPKQSQNEKTVSEVQRVAAGRQKPARIRVGSFGIAAKEPIALLPRGDLAKRVTQRRYRKAPTFKGADPDDFIKTVWGSPQMLPARMQKKVENALLQFTGRLIAGEQFLSFDLDKRGIPWLELSFGEGEHVAVLRWKVADLLASTSTAHPDHDGGETAAALSGVFLALHQALEKALKANAPG